MKRLTRRHVTTVRHHTAPDLHMIRVHPMTQADRLIVADAVVEIDSVIFTL
jgi:hypothetical protein